MKKRIRQWLVLFLGGLIITVFSGSAPASEFSADTVMKGGTMSGKGKIWVKDNKMRQEYDDRFGNIITILDLDQGIHWVLMPQTKTYMKNKIETKGKGFRPENILGVQKSHMKVQSELVGVESVNGYKCDKYVITFSKQEMGTMTQWFAKELGYPIKSISKGGQMGEIVSELQNIVRESVKDDFFKIPSGYKEMQQPQMPQMDMK